MKLFQKRWVKFALLLAFCVLLLVSVYLDAITLWAKEVQMEETGYTPKYRDSVIFKGMATLRDAYGIEELCRMEEKRLHIQDEAIYIGEYEFTDEGELPIRISGEDTTWGEYLKIQGMDSTEWLEDTDDETEGMLLGVWGGITGRTDFIRIGGSDFRKLLNVCSYKRLYSEEEKRELYSEGEGAEEYDGNIEYNIQLEGEIFSGDTIEEVYGAYAEGRLHGFLERCYDFDWDWSETFQNDIKSLRLYESGDSFLIYDEKEEILVGKQVRWTRLSQIEKQDSIYLLMKSESEGSEEIDWVASLIGGWSSSLEKQLRYELHGEISEWREYVHHNYLRAVEISKGGETFIKLNSPDEEDVCISLTSKEELAYVFGKNSDIYKNQYAVYLYYDESYFDSPEEKLYEFFYDAYVKHGHNRTAEAVAVSVITVILGILILIVFVSVLWKREEEKLRDGVLIEVNILFTFCVIVGCCGAIYGIAYLFEELLFLNFYIGGVLLGGAILIEFLALLGVAALYQLISTIVFRIRKRRFLRSWLAGRFAYWLYTKLKRVAQNLDILKRRVLILAVFGILSFIAMLALCICTSIVAGFIGVFGMFCYIAFMIGGSYLFLKDAMDNKRLLDGCNQMKDGMFDKKIEMSNLYFDKLELAEAINTMGEGLEKAVSTSMKDERMKTELITNVSHDIKTPLTSIINYVDLLKRENLTPEEQQEYLKVLDAKSQRLKQLIEDLIEVSKTTSGNIELQLANLDFKELLNQAIGEFEEKFAERNLELVVTCADHKIQIWADGRRCYRILENLFSNVYKYAMPHTRVYVDLQQEAGQMVFTLKNISEAPLNVAVEELMERFVRGDVSRSTNGSGLGLSIAQNLVNLQQGKLEIKLDGDLFKVEIRFPIVP